MNKIFLSEHPHLVIQGEGNLIGKKMLLFRVAGCNLRCKNCDSDYTWKPTEYNRIEYLLPEVTQYLFLNQGKYDFVMITGGAPSLYKDFLYELISSKEDINFQIEDAGDKSWNEFKNFDNVHFSFSPKIGALKDATNIKEWRAFENLPKNWICKVVVHSDTFEDDLNSILKFRDKYYLPDSKIYLMPKGTEREEIIEQSQFIIDKCFDYGFNFSPRLHILIYNNKRLV